MVDEEIKKLDIVSENINSFNPVKLKNDVEKKGRSG